MTGHQEEEPSNGKLMNLGQEQTFTAPPSQVTIGPAQDTDLPSASVDAIIFDPPYHNNVNYAELSDFFYVWLETHSRPRPWGLTYWPLTSLTR